MNSYEVVGYAVDGAVYCVDCTDALDLEQWSPIFAGSEWDIAPTCEECGDELDVCTIEVDDNE